VARRKRYLASGGLVLPPYWRSYLAGFTAAITQRTDDAYQRFDVIRPEWLVNHPYNDQHYYQPWLLNAIETLFHDQPDPVTTQDPNRDTPRHPTTQTRYTPAHLKPNGVGREGLWGTPKPPSTAR